MQGTATTKRLSAGLATLVCLALTTSTASAQVAGPPRGRVLTGVAMGASLGDFVSRVGNRPAIWENFVAWGGSFSYAFDRPEAAGLRPLIAISTTAGQDTGGGLSPGQIAAGNGDPWLVALNARMAAHQGIVYVRPLGEMNNCHNAYAPLNCSGSSRGAAYSTRAFIAAWKRIHIVLSGGTLASVDAKLKASGLPALKHAKDLPEPELSFIWSPMVGGSPEVPSLMPARFYPGRTWVDWAGTSFYSMYPNFSGLDTYYRDFAGRRHLPFMFAEWAIWGGDNPGFARRLFAWVAGHSATRAIIYNQGDRTDGPFRLTHFPQSQRVIRHALSALRFSPQ